MTAAALVGLAVAAAAPSVGAPRRAGIIGAVAVAWPVAGVVCLAATALTLAARRIGRRSKESAAAERDVVLLADLVALGLGAGLGLTEALRSSLRWVSPHLAAEVAGVLRAVRSGGAAVALGSAGGRAAALYHSVAAAAASGAPLVAVVEGFAAERRHAGHARSMEAARRLPVRLLVPLALLILPGFVVLAVGPALLDSLARLDPGR